MRRDVHNWPELVDAVNEMQRSNLIEPRVLVFYDPGGMTHGFVFGEHGLTKFSTDKRGHDLYPELNIRGPFSSEGDK